MLDVAQANRLWSAARDGSPSSSSSSSSAAAARRAIRPLLPPPLGTPFAILSLPVLVVVLLLGSEELEAPSALAAYEEPRGELWARQAGGESVAEGNVRVTRGKRRRSARQVRKRLDQLRRRASIGQRRRRRRGGGSLGRVGLVRGERLVKASRTCELVLTHALEQPRHLNLRERALGAAVAIALAIALATSLSPSLSPSPSPSLLPLLLRLSSRSWPATTSCASIQRSAAISSRARSSKSPREAEEAQHRLQPRRPPT